MKKGVLKNFAKFTEKHLWQSVSFNKVAGLRPDSNKSILENSILRHHVVNVLFATVRSSKILNNYRDCQNSVSPQLT